jgi:hypothetical protein
VLWDNLLKSEFLGNVGLLNCGSNLRDGCIGPCQLRRTDL